MRTPIEKLLDYRSNVQFYDNSKVPPKEDIEHILNTVHERMPHNNNRWHYNIDVLGPDHIDEKRKLAVSSVCARNPDFWRGDDVTVEDWKRVEKVYDRWRDYQTSPEKWNKDHWEYDHEYDVVSPGDGIEDNTEFLGFNEQVTAPWVLMYTPALTTIPPSIKEKAKKEYARDAGWGVDISKGRVERENLGIQFGQHSTLVMLLALEKGYDVSYTRCLIFTDDLFDDTRQWLHHRKPVFALSIGYPILPRRSHSTNTNLPPWPNRGIPRPDIEDIVKW